jgi:signal transduction histidine kinase
MIFGIRHFTRNHKPYQKWPPARYLPLAFILFIFSPFTSARDLNHTIASNISGRLAEIEARLAIIETQMANLPILPDMDALGSHGFHSDFTEDSERNWFEVSWETPQPVDAIALIPTRLSTQSGEMSNYGFPNRLKIVGSTHPGAPTITLAEIQNTHLDSRRGEPVFIPIQPTTLSRIRVIPIDLPKLQGKSVRLFSVSEFMAFNGDENIAPLTNLNAQYSIDAEVGWNIRYLVDEQSPLGPPETPPLPDSLGWHTDVAHTRDIATWATIDLEHPTTIDGVRIIAAKGDSPIKGPGFGFPVRFRIEESDDPAAKSWKTLWHSGPEPFPNPGYNPVTIRFPETTATHVRLLVEEQQQPDILTAPRVLLSEIEILSKNTNVALNRPVSTPDLVTSRPHDSRRTWSVKSLTDGNSSTGKIIPTRQWVSQLSRRFDLSLEQKDLIAEKTAILSRTRTWTITALVTLLSLTVVALVFWQLRLRLAARRHLSDLRRRISSDLHDEVGSNLATISLLSELSGKGTESNRLSDIGRLARESSLSLREIIDLTLISKRARKPLHERLREIANLMLKDHRWELIGDASPNLDPEQRRNLIFFFKEALHNISRHAAASFVTIRIQADHHNVVINIADNGCGMPPHHPNGQPRLRTLQQRADSLHGSLEIHSGPANGTQLTLRFPLRLPAK